jgi:uncharacterized protein YqgC (DUF456 family)
MVILDKFPIWAVYVGTVVVVLVAAEIGFRIGIWLQRRDPDSGKTAMTGAVVGGMLGLMAFLMAFSIGIVINQGGQRCRNRLSPGWFSRRARSNLDA